VFEIPRKRHEGRYYTGACWAPTLFAGPAFCVAVTDVAEARNGEPNWRSQVTEHESGGLRLAGGEQLPSLS